MERLKKIKLFIFGLFNWFCALGILYWCIFGSCQFTFYLETLPHYHSLNDLVSREALNLWFSGLALMITVAALLALSVNVFFLFKEKENPRQLLKAELKNLVSGIWKGTFWQKL